MSDRAPTPADLARDLAADLRLHEREGWTDRPHVMLVCGAALRRALAAEAEAARLQTLVDSLAARVAVQAELLSRRAERW